MKCPICGKRLAKDEQLCVSCENGMRTKKEELGEIIGRHKEWAINRLLFIDSRLDFLKGRVKGFDKEIRVLEKQKFDLFKKLKSSCKTSEVQK